MDYQYQKMIKTIDIELSSLRVYEDGEIGRSLVINATCILPPKIEFINITLGFEQH